uniref:(northern house mosquito) hypothetical protein n=1 Tax=Culex pipiens TaxID=7175 RepID=A0A8D8B363_CULPI
MDTVLRRGFGRVSGGGPAGQLPHLHGGLLALSGDARSRPNAQRPPAHGPRPDAIHRLPNHVRLQLLDLPVRLKACAGVVQLLHRLVHSRLYGCVLRDSCRAAFAPRSAQFVRCECGLGNRLEHSQVARVGAGFVAPRTDCDFWGFDGDFAVLLPDESPEGL